jgi:hypothetical protein
MQNIEECVAFWVKCHILRAYVGADWLQLLPGIIVVIYPAGLQYLIVPVSESALQLFNLCQEVHIEFLYHDKECVPKTQVNLLKDTSFLCLGQQRTQ